MTLKTGVMAAEKLALHHKNKLNFKIDTNRKVILSFNNITDFTAYVQNYSNYI